MPVMNAVRLFLVVLWGFSRFGLLSGDSAFIDEPPDGYYERKSLNDCPKRFYSEDVSSALGFFIFGGSRAFVREFPHMAAIGWTSKSSAAGKVDYGCGGSLISEKFVLTAAHCGYNEDKIAPDVVRLGDTNLDTAEDDNFAQQFKIAKFTMHEEYRKERKYYDIALAELDGAVKFTEAVCPVCLWPFDNLREHSGRLQALGFGVTDFASERSPTLQKAFLNYYDSEECNNDLPRPKSFKEGLKSDQFCAKTPGKDTCHGDSGGPVQIELSDVTKAIPYLTGVVSFGTGCWDGSFGVYTKISSHIDWIKKRVNITTDPLECARNSECLQARKFSDSRLSPQNNSPFFKVDLKNADNSSFHQCSGALIDYRHVVTSASCVMRGGLKPTQIHAYDQYVNIVDIDLHPKFVSSRGSYYNVAVLTLEKFYNPNKIYQIIAPGCVWSEEKIPDPVVFFSGYGPEFKATTTEATKNISLKILVALSEEDGRCNPKESAKVQTLLPQGFNSDFLCTYNPIDLVPGICKLEPGGPISNFRRDNIVPYVYGINAAEGPCGGSENLFVATRLAPHYKWIESVVLNQTLEESPFAIRLGGEIASDEDGGIEYLQTNRVHHQSIDTHDNDDDHHPLVPYIFSDLISSEIPKLHTYGDDLLGSSPIATAQVFHQSWNSTPHQYEIYGSRLLPPQKANGQSPAHVAFTNRISAASVNGNGLEVEIVPSVELPPTHHQQPVTFANQQPINGLPYRGPIPQPVISSTPYASGQYQGLPVRQHGLTSSIIDHNQLVSVIKSIELYESGRCTLPSGTVGVCLHYTRCPAMVAALVHLHLVPFCSRELQTVCCATNNYG